MAIEIVDFSIKDGDVDSYVNLPEDICVWKAIVQLVSGRRQGRKYVTCMCSYAYSNIWYTFNGW